MHPHLDPNTVYVELDSRPYDSELWRADLAHSLSLIRFGPPSEDTKRERERIARERCRPESPLQRYYGYVWNPDEPGAKDWNDFEKTAFQVLARSGHEASLVAREHFGLGWLASVRPEKSARGTTWRPAALAGDSAREFPRARISVGDLEDLSHVPGAVIGQTLEDSDVLVRRFSVDRETGHVWIEASGSDGPPSRVNSSVDRFVESAERYEEIHAQIVGAPHDAVDRLIRAGVSDIDALDPAISEVESPSWWASKVELIGRLI